MKWEEVKSEVEVLFFYLTSLFILYHKTYHNHPLMENHYGP